MADQAHTFVERLMF